MLPRHLIARASRTRTSVLTQRTLAPTNALIYQAATRQSFQSRSLHSSSSRKQNEPLKSPFQTFVDVLKEELQKSRELQDGVKQLQGDVDKLQDSEAMKRARDMYERARVRISRVF